MPARARWCARDHIAWLPPFPPPATALSAPTRQQSIFLFDPFVPPDEHRFRHGETERFRRLEIDDELEFCRLFHRQITPLRRATERCGEIITSQFFPNCTIPMRIMICGNDKSSLTLFGRVPSICWRAPLA